MVAFSRIYAAFAAGYLMSYLFRVVNAVISPELTRELGLHPSALGLLTSTYFVAFAAMQIPAGIMLDRYGPRRIEPVLLAIAAAGAFTFAAAESLGGLTVARALIGAGVSVCLMAPLKGIVEPYRQTPPFVALRSLIARSLRYPPLAPELRRRLATYYAADVARLAELLGRDLSIWACGSAAGGAAMGGAGVDAVAAGHAA